MSKRDARPCSAIALRDGESVVHPSISSFDKLGIVLSFCRMVPGMVQRDGKLGEP